MTRILVVDPIAERRVALEAVLDRNGFTVIGAAEVDATLAAAQHLDLVIARGDSPAANNLRICRMTVTPVMIICARGDVRDAVAAIKAGAAQYFVEPIDTDELIAAIEVEMAAPGRTRELVWDDSIAGAAMIGSSPRMQALYERIKMIAPGDSSVLIQGESGTGKALVARAIHQASHRRHAPLITLNCAVVPEALIETELFGHEGLSDPDRRRHPGLIEAAQSGTLFLDEIGELPAAAQARLLRLLQAGEFRPLGAAQARPIDVRVLAASHRDIGRVTAEGHFREDLYYQLNLITLNLPPLRDRPEDIPALADHLLHRICARLSRPQPVFSAAALAAMSAYDWPGNVRELKNVIERAVILSTGDELDAGLLAITPQGRISAPQAMVEPEATTLEDYFVRFVQENQDDLTETELAAKLGISRKSLWERRQRLNIPRRSTVKRGPRRQS